MVNQASIDSFYAFPPEDLDGRRRQIYLAIREGGPLTNRELGIELNLPINSVTGRVRELVQMGLVVSFGRRFDPCTNRSVNEWIVTEESF